VEEGLGQGEHDMGEDDENDNSMSQSSKLIFEFERVQFKVNFTLFLNCEYDFQVSRTLGSRKKLMDLIV